MRRTVLIIALMLPMIVVGLPLETYSTNLANLIDPAKLATLGKRQANPRVQKSVAILEDARRDGWPVATVSGKAVMLAGYTNIQLIVMTQLALTRNHDIAERLGVLTDAGLNDMRRGQSPTIQVGKYKDDELSVDHIVPRAVAPELDNVIANLELMPLRMNKSKSAKMGARQFDYAKKFKVAGLLSEKRLDKILGK